ncbi:MAG: ribosome maturation factor RimM [Oscillospiraceae bacterium]
MKNKFIECGKIVTTHGIKGEVKIEPWADSPEFLFDFKKLYLEKGEICLKVLSCRMHKNMVLAIFEGYDDIDKSNTLRSKILYIDREDANLDEDDYFWQDLIGLNVVDVDDETISYGKITNITETGANDVYYIKDEDGNEKLIPAIPQVIIKIDMDNEKMFIRPLEGLFDED